MNDTYLTIQQTSESLYKEKGSKFIGLAMPVVDEEDVKSQLETIKKQYHDARHHCYAYILGEDGGVYRANDDGEPNHSAGDPILGQIRSATLTHTLVVVIRYFGGTKLGVSGLINAYKTAAAEAIASNTIKEEIITETVNFSFDYLAMNDVMRLVKDYELEIVSQDFDNTCHMKVRVRRKHFALLTEKLESIPDLALH